ncbi:hypothetical protein BJ508DRAFT_141777 [Ascobolus immersus RN42]|uniref:Uncharacterized protein n=1 Tax=Ascobolus immersus RN42 TaxID=1160509 RepID=A0A3N4HZP1_ASCIM|nr:hypothetical protein BJ508DRAFT_141777 [Ascobolus immersus RN42]
MDGRSTQKVAERIAFSEAVQYHPRFSSEARELALVTARLFKEVQGVTTQEFLAKKDKSGYFFASTKQLDSRGVALDSAAGHVMMVRTGQDMAIKSFNWDKYFIEVCIANWQVVGVRNLTISVDKFKHDEHFICLKKSGRTESLQQVLNGRIPFSKTTSEESEQAF